MNFDTLGGAVSELYRWYIAKDKNSDSHKLIDLYFSAEPSTRVRLQAGFALIGAAVAAYGASGPQLFIDAGLLEPPTHEEN